MTPPLVYPTQQLLHQRPIEENIKRKYEPDSCLAKANNGKFLHPDFSPVLQDYKHDLESSKSHSRRRRSLEPVQAG